MRAADQVSLWNDANAKRRETHNDCTIFESATSHGLGPPSHKLGLLLVAALCEIRVLSVLYSSSPPSLLLQTQ